MAVPALTFRLRLMRMRSADERGFCPYLLRHPSEEEGPIDADLLRIRRVRFTLRVQTALASLRGPAGLLFTHGGLSRAAGRTVPDVEIQFDVTPRNLNLEPGTWNPEHE